VACSKENIGAWPPATTMASKRATSISLTGLGLHQRREAGV
jgi:hypothetical protein